METGKPSLKKLGKITRQAVTSTSEQWIKTEQLSDHLLPLLVTPAIDGLDFINWPQNHQDWLKTKLLKHGGILFRNSNIKNIDGFQKFIASISSELLDYTYRSTPRSQVDGKIYTSTEYPANQSIPQHHEMAYSRNWPGKIWFFCVTASETGGETPIADARRVFARIPQKIKEKFIAKKVMYVRNYGDGLDLTWENVFQTNNQDQVEQICRQRGIEWEWKGNNRLTTKQICQATTTHPQTGDVVWFNQAHLFHISNLPSQVQELLLEGFGEEGLPRNSYYGDGSPIEASFLQEIREIYDQEMVMFSWQPGDILMLDNMLASHGRKPFTGSRKVVVGMAEEYRSPDF
jgi:alpha-ketoglutarate-dependent taurine dioxygenase